MNLQNILEQIGHPRILVLGDLILDKYTFGKAERVSPEAPVVVLRVDGQEVRLGGAASVAMLLRGLEAQVTLAGVVGDDSEGRTLKALLHDEQIDCDSVLIDASRPTTMKERIIGRAADRHGHQIVRVDHEACTSINEDLEEQLLARLMWGRFSTGHSEQTAWEDHSATDFDAILISDYSKGVCTPTLLRRVIDMARSKKIPIIVDPARIADYSRYRGATLLKPNRIEAALATGRRIDSPAEALAAGKQLTCDHQLDGAVITLDREGMAVVQSDGSNELFSAEPREVYDITGAGDMVLAALGLCVASDVPLAAAVRVANVAAGLEVERFGVAPISRVELAGRLPHHQPESRDAVSQPAFDPASLEMASIGNSEGLGGSGIPNSASKVTSISQLLPLVDDYRRSGKTIVFTNGCFDLLHIGHLATLEQAAALGDVLIVAINSDNGVHRLKGPDRPIIRAHERARMLAALSCVNHVLIFDEPTPHHLLDQIRPDILAKGGTTPQIIGQEAVASYGGRAIRLPEVPGFSTTALLQGRTVNRQASTSAANLEHHENSHCHEEPFISVQNPECGCSRSALPERQFAL